MLALGAGAFVFIMVLISLSIINAILPIFSDNTITTIALVLGIAIATYNWVKK